MKENFVAYISCPIVYAHAGRTKNRPALSQCGATCINQLKSNKLFIIKV